jgi:hypothetical protein
MFAKQIIDDVNEHEIFKSSSLIVTMEFLEKIHDDELIENV